MKKTLLISVLILCVTALVIVWIVVAFREKKERDFITLYGNVDVRQVDIGFRVAGQVTELFFEEGDVVREGDLMCVLDTTPYDSQFDEAVALREAIVVNLENAE